MLCAVLDSGNLTFPPVNTTNKSLKPRAFGMYLPSKGRHRPGAHGDDSLESGSEEEEEEERRQRKEMEKHKVGGRDGGEQISVGS